MPRDFTVRMLGMIRELGRCATENNLEIARLRKKGQAILGLICIAQTLAANGLAKKTSPKKPAGGGPREIVVAEKDAKARPARSGSPSAGRKKAPGPHHPKGRRPSSRLASRDGKGAPLVAEAEAQGQEAPGPSEKIGGGGAIQPPFSGGEASLAPTQLEAIVKLGRCYAGRLDSAFIARVLAERGELRMGAAEIDRLLAEGGFTQGPDGKWSLKK